MANKMIQNIIYFKYASITYVDVEEKSFSMCKNILSRITEDHWCLNTLNNIYNAHNKIVKCRQLYTNPVTLLCLKRIEYNRERDERCWAGDVV